MSVHKKYCVVEFEDRSVEVVPSKWLVDNRMTKWPKKASQKQLEKLLRSCVEAEEDWDNIPIIILSSSNDFKKASTRADRLTRESQVSCDSSGLEGLSRKRKTSKWYGPTRIQPETEDSEPESPSIIKRKKMYQLPEFPEGPSSRPKKRKECSSRIPQEVTQECGSQRYGTNHHMSEDSEPESPSVLKSHCVPQFPETPSYQGQKRNNPKELTTKECSGCPDAKAACALFQRILVQIEGMKEKMDAVHGDVKRALDVQAVPEGMTHLVRLPDDLALPINSEEELVDLNERMKADRNLAATMVRYLHEFGHGKTERAFMSSLLKKLLCPALALQYSLYGRKGKRSFSALFSETLNIILAAAAKRFGPGKEKLLDAFAKSLANAGDWIPGRKHTRPTFQPIQPQNQIVADTLGLDSLEDNYNGL